MKKIYILLAVSISLVLSSCFDDKGNYDYKEVDSIKIENIPDLVEVLGNSENIKVTPKITSQFEGLINADNQNYSYQYKLEKKSGGWIGNTAWQLLNPNGEMILDTLATFPADTYVCWFIVTDKRTGMETSTTFEVKVTSTTYEGWMILCNEGSANRVRMDMIFRLSAEREVSSFNVLETAGLPACNNAYEISFYPNSYATPGDQIFVFSESGGYMLNKETFATDESWNVFNVDFIAPPTSGVIQAYQRLNSGSSYGGRANFCVTTTGNAYVLNLGSSGAAFELPINTSVRGGAVEFKVAPYVGVSKSRPGNGQNALFYDVDNKRFCGWAFGTYATQDARHVLTPLTDATPTDIFSFNTGKELVYMESTRYSGGLVYSVMKDAANKISIYGINMSGNGFTKESYYENLNAPDIENATQYAFHSQFPYMFYSVNNKLYLHNLGTNTTYPMSVVGLGGNDEITLLKFNLFEQANLSLLNNQDEDFLAKQFQLIVGSYDKTAPDNTCGKLQFFKVDGTNNSISKKIEYTGFAKIKDVVYRERR